MEAARYCCAPSGGRRCLRVCAPPAAGRGRRRSRRAGCRASRLRPSTRISPASGRSTPAIRRRSSVRPAPTRPEMPSTSPLRSLKLASRTAVPRDRPATSSTISSVAKPLCSAVASSRPTMRATTALSVVSFMTTSVTLRPSRRIVAVSQTRKTSSILCET